MAKIKRATYYKPEERAPRRPSTVFFWDSWVNDRELRRCSRHLKGLWMDLLALLHDSDEYGILRWPIADLCNALHCEEAEILELMQKNVLKGAVDSEGLCGPVVYSFSQRSSRRGESVTVLEAQPGPIFFCSRFVRDEFLRETKVSEGVKAAKSAKRTARKSKRESPARPFTAANEGTKPAIKKTTNMGNPTEPPPEHPPQQQGVTHGTPPRTPPPPKVLLALTLLLTLKDLGKWNS